MIFVIERIQMPDTLSQKLNYGFQIKLNVVFFLLKISF